MSKKDRREHARETARLMREEEQRRRRRGRLLVQGSIIVGVIAVLAVVGIVISAGVASGNAPGPKNMLSDGILLTGSKGKVEVQTTRALKAGETPVKTNYAKYKKQVNVITYIDYQCPYCEQFETTNESTLLQGVEAGAVTLEIHPIAILNASSGTNMYSTRAANAAACVANYEPDKFFAVNKALYANQPEENTGGEPDSKLLSVVKGAGATSSAIPGCITSQRFKNFVTDATTRATSKPLPNSSVKKVTGTPTVIIDGKQYGGSLSSASSFETALAQAYAAKTGS